MKNIITFELPEIECISCVNAIKKHLMKSDNISNVDGDPKTKIISVDTSSSPEEIKRVLQSIGFQSVFVLDKLDN